jgi:hypothetical protein
MAGVWLGSLIELLAPFGDNDRLLRTSVFQLAQWTDGACIPAHFAWPESKSARMQSDPSGVSFICGRR